MLHFTVSEPLKGRLPAPEQVATLMKEPLRAPL